MMKKITSANFKKYGRLIEFPKKRAQAKGENLFCIVASEPKKVGWRIAYLVVRDKVASRLEQHPHSYESFEPVKGKGLLYVSALKNPARIECFVLTRPVVLKKGIWHAVVALDKECEIKITENARVRCVYWKIGFSLPNHC
jgi:ureidoglycolate hydrolase